MLGAALAVALLGALIERLLLRHLYGREELYQLLFTYARGAGPGATSPRCIWGTQQLSVPRPPSLAGACSCLARIIPHYNLFIIAARAGDRAARCWLLLQPHRHPDG